MNFPHRTFPRPPVRGTAQDESAFRLHFNESPLGVSPKVADAIRAEADKIGNYPLFSDKSLREALARVWKNGLTADHFYTGCSGYEAIELATRAFITDGDELISCSPTFGIYKKLALQEGGVHVDVPLLLSDFRVDVDGILNEVNEKTRIVLICNPNNPTGTMMDSADFHRLITNLPDQVLLVADEVYCHFVTDPTYPNAIQYIHDGYNIISTQSFSKAYGMAGLRVGYAIARPEIANYVAGFQRGFHQNRLAHVAITAALQDQDHLWENVRVALEGKQWICTQLDALGIAYVPSQTNFIIVKLPDTLSANEVAAAMRAQNILVKPQKDRGLENTLRVSATVPEGNRAFIDALKTFVNREP